MAEPGEVRAVAWMPQGSELLAGVSLGALSLPIDNPVDFDEDGGTLDLNGTQLDYDTVDLDLGIITLSSASPVAASAGDRVNVVSGGSVVIDYMAFVSLGDGDEIEVPIPYAQRDLWPEGEYDSPIMVELSDDLETIVAVPGRTPVRDGSFIDPATLPTPELPPLTDGLPPTSSPAAIVLGGIGALFIRWTAITNPDPVTYDVHLSTTPGFTPSPATLLSSTPGTSVTARALPDGTALAYQDSSGGSRTYYARIVARDADPGSAPPGVEGNGSLVQVTGPDVAANYVYAGSIVADQIDGGTIRSDVLVSASLRTASSGQRVEVNSQGITLWAPDDVTVQASLPTDPASPVYIHGEAELDKTTINGSLAIRGTNNELSKDSVLNLAGKVSNPQQSPTPTISWDAVQPWWQPAGGSYDNFSSGLAWVPSKSAWAVMNMFFGNGLYLASATGAFVSNNPIAGQSGTGGPNKQVEPRGGMVYHTGTSSFFALVLANRDSDWTDQWEIRKYGHPPVWNDGSSAAPLLARYVIGDKGSSFQNADPIIGLDGTGVSVFYYRAAGDFGRATVDTSTCVMGSFQTVGPVTGTLLPGAPSRVGYAQRGPFDFGDGNTYVMAAHRSSSDLVGGFTNNAFPGSRNTGLDFPVGNMTSYVLGGHFGGPDSNFHTMRSDGLIYTYSPIRWTTESSKWYSGFVLKDTDPAGTGLHQTGLSLKSSFTMTKRAVLSLTAPTIPDNGLADDPDSVDFYLGRGTSAPLDSAMFLNGSPASGVRAITLRSVAFSGSTAPTNNFPSSGAAKVLDSSGNLLFDAQGYGIWAPTGAIQMFGVYVAPTGWLLCNGQLVSRTIYAALFNVIGTAFGAGDGSTTFAVPNFIGRFPRGGSTPGNTGGADSVTMPDHTHGVGTYATAADASTRVVATGSLNAASTNHTHSITGNSGIVIGANPPISNIPTYTAVAYIIKT